MYSILYIFYVMKWYSVRWNHSFSTNILVQTFSHRFSKSVLLGSGLPVTKPQSRFLVWSYQWSLDFGAFALKPGYYPTMSSNSLAWLLLLWKSHELYSSGFLNNYRIISSTLDSSNITKTLCIALNFSVGVNKDAVKTQPNKLIT